MWLIAAAWALELTPNTDLVAPAGPDAVCLPFPRQGRFIDLPVGKAASAIRVRWTTTGPMTAGLGAILTLTFADGTVKVQKATVGDQLGAEVGPGRTTEPVRLGTSAAGAPVLGEDWTIEIGSTAVLQTLRIDSRAGKGAAVCVVSVEVESGEPRPTPGYVFPMATRFPAPVPQSVPVEAPAGKHGRVKTGPDGHLYFEDGTRARFYGVNLQSLAALPQKADADAIAATLAGQGFNIVRVHHIDDGISALVNKKRGEPGQPVLVPEVVDRLDFFLSRLAAHGIYLFLETATLRAFTEADGVTDPTGSHKFVGMWEPDWLAAHRKWIRDLWGRTNPYTQKRYADDPMVAVIELSNEHSLVASWGGGIESLPLVHLARLDTRWNEWLRAHYADDAALNAAWTGSDKPGLQPGETLGTVEREPKYGSLGGSWPEQRRRDLLGFYAELEAAYYKALDEEVRALGFTAPIVPTLPYNRPDIHQAHAAWPVSDTHFEWDNLRKDQLRNDSVLTWPTTNESPLEMLLGAREGTAVFASEMNHPFPNQYGAEAPIFWAAMAAIQDFDGLIWFNYNPLRTPDATIDDPFDISASPPKLVQVATASSLFRGGWVDAARGRMSLWYGGSVAEDSRVNGRGPLPFSIYEPGTLLSRRVRVDVGAAPSPIVEAAPVDGVGWWTKPGLFVLDRPMVQARIGPPDDTTSLGAGVTAPSRLRVRGQGWAAVTLASADGQPLATGKKALLTVATRVQNSGMLWSADQRYLRDWGTGPGRVDPFVGTIDIKADSRPKVRRMGVDGTPGEELAVKPAGDGWWRLTLDATVACPWFFVER